MVCKYCNEMLPDDSEFCQYCGRKIETDSANAGEEYIGNDLSAPQNLATEEAVDAFIEMQVEQTVKTFEENRKSQPNNEEADDFGLVLEKPIYTLAYKSVSGEIEYLDKLYKEDGVKIKWERRGSACADSVNGPVDIYDTYLPSGDPYKTIYINMYGAEESRKAPAGFILRSVETKPKRKKKTKTKFCSRCGAVIDSETKKCTGCGKQYFRGVKLKKSAIISIVLTLLLAVSGVFNVIQIIDRIDLEEELRETEARRKYLEKTANELEDEIDDLESEVKDAQKVANFIDKYVVFVVNDGTNVYHKFECYKFQNGERYWAYNIDAAKGKGYTACSICH